MELKQWHGFCLCPLGGACPPDAAPADAPFSPLVFLVRRDPLRSRGLFAVTVLDEVFEAETAGVLLPPVQRLTPAEPLREFVAANGACVLNTAFSAAFSVLERWHRKRTQPLRVTLVGLGDVGGTLLLALKLLGRELGELRIYDPNAAQCRRYELELNQVLPLDHPLPPVTVCTEDTLFDCDLLLFTASRGVPPVGSGVADVRLASPALLRTALAENTFGRNVTDTVSELAGANGAVLAINGDFYGSRKSGWCLRNGVLYRDTAASSATELLLVDASGDFSIADDRTMTAGDADGLWQIFSFGPALVTDGEVSVADGDEVARSMASNPRTAIGQIGPLHYAFVVTDGRTEESAGLSLVQLADLMLDIGCETAYNLDGGGSSTMVFQGEVVNNPTTNGRTITEREVSDIVYIGL